jgi:Protein of unknown function (DUF3617)
LSTAPIAAALFLTALLAARPATAALDMSEGLWETEVTADGQTRALGTYCYTKADIAEMERTLHGRSAHSGACRYSDFAQAGSSVRYTMTCRYGDDEQRSAVVVEYRGDSATGTISSGGVSVTTRSWRVASCSQSSFAR